MEKAKGAVKDFMAKAGHHDTTVHETVAPAVTNETVERRQHENVTTAVDKEVHQDHYHTSVQPVADREVLPEQHHHNLVPVEHKSYDHDNTSTVKEKLAMEAAKFKDTSTRVEGEHTHSVNPVLGGEHVHHHVHENIQPVVQKQTVEPHVVHTTVPVHEVHHNASQHHSTSALPPVSMSDFKKQGGTLTGRAERQDGFEGEPRNIGSNLGGESTMHGTTGHGTTSHNPLTSHGSTGHGTTSHNPLTGHGTTGSTTTSNNPLTGHGTTGSTTTSNNPLSSNHGTTGTGTTSNNPLTR